jgi:hypothetical protein
MFGLGKKVEGKKMKGKNVRGMKVSRKWMESKMIFILFGMNESEKKMNGKIDTYLVNDRNILTFKMKF